MASRRIILAAGLIVLAGSVAYLNGCSGPLVLDDVASIAQNPTIRHLGSAWTPPPHSGVTVSGRPVLNFSLALNWAAGGAALWGYHAANVLIHLLAALTLFGLVRRTLAKTEGETGALWIAWAAALLWAVHPLQTEAVTYIIQRAESLMGLCYLLTLYGFVRYATEAKARWAVVSVLACLLGMGTKEVMVSAPVLVFLYDRVFVAGSWREAWRRRRLYYGALAATWLPLAYLVASTGNRGGTSGAGIGVPAWSYWLTQFPAILQYLRLTVWPHPLVFDYGTEWIRQPLSAVPAALAVLALGAGVVWLWLRRPALGFAGIAFFAILAPTSVIPGGRQTMAEHRLYLALAPLAVVAALGLARATKLRPVFFLIVGLVGAGLVGATLARNQDYRSAWALYSDNVRQKPDNPFVRNNLGMALAALGRKREAVAQYRAALRLNADAAETHNNLGVALSDLGQEEEAKRHYLEAIRLRPAYAAAYSNLGQTLFHLRELRAAEASLRRALELEPGLAEAHLNLGNILFTAGQAPAAEAQFREALRLDPGYAEAENNLGNLLFRQGRLDEALAHVRAALRLNPRYPEPHLNLANLLASTGHLEEAAAEYRQTLQLDPGNPDAHYNLAQVLHRLGRNEEAADELARARAASAAGRAP